MQELSLTPKIKEEEDKLENTTDSSHEELDVHVSTPRDTGICLPFHSSSSLFPVFKKQRIDVEKERCSPIFVILFLKLGDF